MELKFRAWDLNDKEYSDWETLLTTIYNATFYGDWNEKQGKPYREGLDGVSLNHFTDQDIILEQWTGLYDKKGKEIYEGDIVDGYFNAGPAGDFVIREVPVTFGSFGINIQHWCFEKGNEWALPEIIGNIHQGRLKVL